MRYWEGQKRAEPLPPANDEHLELVQQLDKVQWNEWRSSNPDVIPTLFNADLKGVDLSGYNLRKAKLDGANLTDAKLQGTNFGDASLSEAILYRANLDRANFAGANLQDIKRLSAVPPLRAKHFCRATKGKTAINNSTCLKKGLSRSICHRSWNSYLIFFV